MFSFGTFPTQEIKDSAKSDSLYLMGLASTTQTNTASSASSTMTSGVRLSTLKHSQFSQYTHSWAGNFSVLKVGRTKRIVFCGKLGTMKNYV